MQHEAYRLTGFTAVIAALGFLLRWLQNMNIIDPLTGLARQGTVISFLLSALIIIVAAALAAFAFYLRQYDCPSAAEEALSGHTFLFTVFGVLIAAMLAVSGAIQLLQSGSAEWPMVHRLCGICTLAAAVGVLLLITGASNAEKGGARRFGSAVLVVFGCLWLITIYKDSAADPVLWTFAIEILAVCSSLIAFYYLAGYQYGEPKPLAAIFFCNFGAFLCIISAIDEHTLAESICYASVALLLLMWGFVLVENLQKADRPFKLDDEIKK